MCAHQKLESVLSVLEDGLAKHAVMMSEECRHRTRELEDLKALLRSPQTAAILHLHEQQIARRTKATDHLKARYVVSDAFMKWFYLFLSCSSLLTILCSSTGSAGRM